MQHTFLLEEGRGLSSVGFWQEPGPRRRGLQVPQPSRPRPFGTGDQFCGKQVCPQTGGRWGCFSGESSVVRVLCSLFLSRSHQPRLRPSGLDPGGCRPLL